ncbi:MAG: ribose-phosphate pyrophosphokinase [Candidatus Dojkabacteria bacterium]|nr:ribose-phosphate pyrophosphokinase [Candidatus Dojkabacteria bacterium]
MKNKVLLAGSSNLPLARKIAKGLGVKLGKIELEEFPNGELRVRVLEKVKGETIFILQSANFPAERHILELGLIADAVKRCGAKKVVAIIPWFGYSAQDKVFRDGEPLSSKVVVRILESTEIDEFVTVDIHSPLVLKMFNKRVYDLSAASVFIDYFRDKLSGDWVVVALDKGADARAKEFSNALKLPLVKFDKSRDRKSGEVTFHRLSGSVRGRNVISFDDFVSTGGTRIKGSEFLKREGARKYYDCVTHLIVPKTTRKLEKSKIDKMYITDSILLDRKWKFSKLKIITMASLIGDFIKRY